jgi:nitroreductase
MKVMLKKIMPKIVIKKVKRYLYSRQGRKFYNWDRKRFLNSAIELTKNKTQENIESKITLSYHSLEKGMSNRNIRYGFGKNALNILMESLEEFVEIGFNKDSIPFQTGLSVLSEYIDMHLNKNINIDWITERFNILINNCEVKSYGGIYSLKKENILENSSANFEILSSNRHSVRDYANGKIEKDIIIKAIEIAMNTPSVCNRQPWKVHFINDEVLVAEILNLQGGLRGQGEGLKQLLLITSDSNFFTNFTERNQGFIDSGMFAMSLLYSFTYLGVASCSLNTNFYIDKEIKIRRLLNIHDNENLVMFISIGNYLDEFSVPKSKRDNVSNKLKIYE